MQKEKNIIGKHIPVITGDGFAMNYASTLMKSCGGNMSNAIFHHLKYFGKRIEWE